MAENENQKKESPGSRKEFFILLLIFAILAGVLAGAFYFLWEKLKPPRLENKISIEKLPAEIPRQPEAEKQETAAEEEEAIEQEKFNPAELDVKVLNAGAAGGSATKTKELLEAEGYAKTQADNARMSGYAGVAIHYKTEMKEPAQEIKEILSATYKVIETKEGLNEKEISGDIVIILGR